MDHIKLFNDDAVNILKQMKKESIDLAVLDPPYRVISGGKGDENSPKGMLSENDGKIFAENNVSVNEWAELLFAVMKNESHVYIMTNTKNLTEYLNVFQKVGFKLHNLLVWKKNNATPNRWYMKNAEYILFLRKGKAKPINDCGSKTVLSVDNILGNKLHPTQKPTELLEILVLNSSEVGEVVLDCFMGSGSTGVVAKKHKRRFIGVELDKNYFDIAEKRIKSTLTV